MRWLLLFLLPVVTALGAVTSPAGLENAGAPIDLTNWNHRARIDITADGNQQLDLDLPTLAHSASDWRDLRVVREGRQFPYVIARQPVPQTCVPRVEPVSDAKQPSVSRWKIHLPVAGVSWTRLVCQSKTPLFTRRAVLLEHRGKRTEESPRQLGTAQWSRRPEENMRALEVTIASQSVGSELILEIDNGDNPPIELHDIALEYPTARLIFPASVNSETYLYYDNPQAGPPSYDLDLIGQQLRSTPTHTATLDGHQVLHARSLTKAARSKVIYTAVFWLVLLLVVVVLLIVIVRLMPKEPRV